MTIEERAKEFAMDAHDFDCEGCDTCSKCRDYRMFVDIATEQKAIDIDNACSILCRYACPHKIDSNKCFNTMCETWEIFRRMMEK